MRFLAIILSFYAVLFACKDKATTALRTRKAAKVILPDKQIKYQRWMLSQLFDPYQEGYTYYSDTLNPTYLEIYQNGDFKKYEPGTYSEGIWKLNKTRNKLAFIYELMQEIEVPQDLRDEYFRYEIHKLTKDTFVLAIPGRHGMLKETWIRDSIHLPHPSDTISVDTLFKMQTVQDSLKSAK